MKCEVLRDITLTVKKGSVVEIDPLQFEVAKHALKPIKKTTTRKK